jgi:hypothetical protein
LNSNDEEQKLQKSLLVMDLVSDLYFNENFQLERANAYKKLGNKRLAKELLEDLIRRNLLTEKAQNLLSTIKV